MPKKSRPKPLTLENFKSVVKEIVGESEQRLEQRLTQRIETLEQGTKSDLENMERRLMREIQERPTREEVREIVNTELNKAAEIVLPALKDHDERLKKLEAV